MDQELENDPRMIHGLRVSYHIPVLDWRHKLSECLGNPLHFMFRFFFNYIVLRVFRTIMSPLSLIMLIKSDISDLFQSILHGRFDFKLPFHLKTVRFFHPFLSNHLITVLVRYIVW